MRLLVTNGTNVNINLADKRGRTALHWAAWNGHEGVAWWLQMITIMGDTVLSYSYGLFASRLVTQENDIHYVLKEIIYPIVWVCVC